MRASLQSKSVARRAAIITEQILQRSTKQGALAAPFFFSAMSATRELCAGSAKADTQSPCHSPLAAPGCFRYFRYSTQVRRSHLGAGDASHRKTRVSTDDIPETEAPVPAALPVLPLRDVVVYPHMVIPLFVGREKSILALDQAMRAGKQILLVAQKQADVDDPGAQDLYRLGTVATILQLLKLPDGTVKVLVEGAERAKIEKLDHRPVLLRRSVSPFKDVEQYDEREMDVLARSVTSQFEQYVKLNRKVPPEVLTALAGIEQPGRLADNVAAHMSLKLDAKQKVLEIQDVRKRLEHILALIEGEMDVLQIEKRIRGRVKQQMEKSQREYYLNEQMKAIQKELGEIEDAPNELAELEQRIQKAGMPKEARDKAMTELNKLKLMSPMSAEATVVRNYVDWLVKCPWKKKTKVHNDIGRRREGARRRPLRPGEGEGAHRRIPRRAAAREDAQGPDPVPGRPAGRRQDLARPVDRACDQPQVRAHVARRRAR